MNSPVSVESSRTIPVEQHHAFETTLSLPLTDIFTRRYGLLPPVKQIKGQEGAWSTPGQARTICTTDGGSMREELLEVNAPNSFSYRISDVAGPLRPLVAGIEGRWQFTPSGTGTQITWSWVFHPRGAIAAPVVSLIGMMWRGYARQALEVLSEELIRRQDAGRTAG